MGKQKVESQEDKAPFDLLEETKEEENKVMSTTPQVLGLLKLQYITKKSKNGKINYQLQLQNKEQLNILLANINKIQNALNNNEYIVTSIASRSPYGLTLVITKTSAILKIVYLSGYIKNVNMSIPISANTIVSLQQILTALTTSEVGKKLLSISNINSSQQNENLL